MSGEAISARAGGRIVEANVQEGMHVEAGDVLVRLDPSKIDHEISKLERSIAADEEELGRLDSLRRASAEEEKAARAKLRQEIEEARLGADRERARRDKERERTGSERSLADLALAEARERAARVTALVEEGLEPAEKQWDAEQELKRAEAKAEAARKAAVVGEEDVQVAEARLETLARQEDLLRAEFAKRGEELSLRVDARQAELDTSRSTREALLRDREAYEIRAHTTGVVTSGHPRVGDFVEPGKPFLAIAQEKGFRVDVAVPAADVGSLRVGMKARVKLDAFDYRDYGAIEGTVYEIAPDSQIIDRVMIYVVRVRLASGEVVRGGRRGAVRFGMSAQVEFLVGHERISALMTRKVREKVSLN